MTSSASATICSAIELRRELRFIYDGKPRTVQSYCHGWTAKGDESLRAIQVDGEGSSLRSGKLWTVAKMERVELSHDAFVPDDPHYNPNDSALPRIHCRI